ncbi:K(+)-transporting ATPase subunit C [Chenggangzhangella methanolivorans]|uniref:Potassium-transporting ATPase KdpC subunit n=1 Tax=Chenggangzhangella methanolivorans TaxID=1437009 RepID=A0A9E6UNV7_9HYPH|nr:K(+)-transporting ATPase subunit C [Chenggangzhangella methanolivorans]QZN99014.1 K(+)-transporting ATPase subunit C [Chenggangzhangella methanolivorans]
MLNHLRPALVLLGAFTLLTGVAYPFAMTGIAQVAFPRQALGSLVEQDGKVIGSSIMGQSFTTDRYFQSRPSATVGPDPADPSKSISVPYNAANSGGSNYGPTSKALIERVSADVEARKAQNPSSPVPMDLVTASASGLDPHLSPEAALFQVERVAKARGVPADQVKALVERSVEPRTFGLLGEPRVNVLALNLALDKVGSQ